VREAPKHIQAHLITDIPRIEVENPRIHEIGRNRFGVGGERRQELGLVDGVGPKSERKRLITPV
jgi:hypothetical protein